MNIKAILFDLDGTLADTALDLGGALNRLLLRKGLPEVAMEKIRPIASHGANGLIYLGAGVDIHHPDHAQWRKEYLAEYEYCFCDKTVLFNQINEMIGEIVARGLIWGIVTNKPKIFTDRLIPTLGFRYPPSVVVSGDTTAQAKPSVLPMNYACECIGVSPDACLYVGDALRDMQAGRNAGMKTILVNWGYIADDDDVDNWPCDATIDHPMQLIEFIK